MAIKTMPEDRRLAAIMFTDIVGYTALMGSNQEKAFKLLRNNREIQQQLIQKFKGKLLKEMGDGILAQFNSATDAMQCAIDIQQRAREELECKIRIGIHLSDVTFENEDVFGDGVNIASRLQSITDPGGIYISESTQKATRGRGDIQTKFLGSFILKNVDYPVRTYCVQGEGLPVPAAAKIKKLSSGTITEKILGSVYTYIVLVLLVSVGWWIRKDYFTDKSTISSLIFLPFENYTGSDTLDYLFAGMHDALIGEAGKISALRVKSKTTANAYKDAKKSIPEIATETNSDAAVETSISCFGEQICFQVVVVDAREDKQIWVKDYYAEKSQIPNLFRNIAKEISEEINVSLTHLEEKLLAETRAVNPDAYDAYLRGQFYWERLDRESMQKALDYFQLAIEKDPEWADPYAGLAKAWGTFGMFIRTLPKSVTLPKMYKYLDKALELDPNSAQAHYVKAINSVWIEFDWEQGEEEFLKSLELNPSDALCRLYYSHLLRILGRSDEAVIQANLALDLDPMNPLILSAYEGGQDNDPQSAIPRLEKALSIDPNFGLAIVRLNDIHMRTAFTKGDYEKWIELWDKKTRGIWHWNDEGRAAVLNAFHEKGYIAAIEEMFKMNEKYGNDCWMSYDLKAERYLILKNYDKAMDCLEKGYEMRDMNMAYITNNLYLYDQLKDNPRYIELLKKMNLPLP